MTPKSYSIAPQLRRSCWYGVVATPILAAIGAWVSINVKGLALAEAVAVAAVLVSIGLFLLVPLTWRLRVDSEGLTRMLLGVRAFWPWEDFARGAIEKRPDQSFVHIEWAWWNPRRNLTLPIDVESRREVLAVINEHYPIPAAPEVPDSLSLRFGWRRIELDEKGIHHGDRSWLWSEVELVDIQRDDARSWHCSRLVIVLPGQTLRFVGNPKADYQFIGAEPAVLAQYVLRNAPADQIAIATSGQPLASQAQAKLRAAEAEKAARGFWRLTTAGGVIMSALIAFAVLDKNWSQALRLATIACIPIGLPYAWMNLHLRKHAAAWRDYVDSGAWQTSPPPTSER